MFRERKRKDKAPRRSFRLAIPALVLTAILLLSPTPIPPSLGGQTALGDTATTPQAARTTPIKVVVSYEVDPRNYEAFSRLLGGLLNNLRIMSEGLKGGWPGHPGLKIVLVSRYYLSGFRPPIPFEEEKRRWLTALDKLDPESRKGIEWMIKEHPEDFWCVLLVRSVTDSLGLPVETYYNAFNFKGEKLLPQETSDDTYIYKLLYKGAKMEFSLGHNFSVLSYGIEADYPDEEVFEYPFLMFNLNGCNTCIPRMDDNYMEGPSYFNLCEKANNGHTCATGESLLGNYYGSLLNGDLREFYKTFMEMTPKRGKRRDVALVATEITQSHHFNSRTTPFLTNPQDPNSPIARNMTLEKALTLVGITGHPEIQSSVRPFVLDPISLIDDDRIDPLGSQKQKVDSPEYINSKIWGKLTGLYRPLPGFMPPVKRFTTSGYTYYHYLYHLPELDGQLGKDVYQRAQKDPAFYNRYRVMTLDPNKFVSSLEDFYRNGPEAFYLYFPPLVFMGNDIKNMTLQDFFGVKGTPLPPNIPDPILKPSTRHELRGNVDEYILIANPHQDKQAKVTVKLYNKRGYIGKTLRTIPPLSRTTVMVNDLIAPGSGALNGADNIGDCEARSISASIESDVPVLAERAMYFSPRSALGATDGTCAGPMDDPETTHFFADGSGAWGWKTFYCFFNPNNEPVDLKLTFMPQGKAEPWVENYQMPPKTRLTVVGREGLDYSCRAEASKPITAERAMYNLSGEAKGAAGVEQSSKIWSKEWIFPDGYVDLNPHNRFKTYILIQNPLINNAGKIVIRRDVSEAESLIVRNIPIGMAKNTRITIEIPPPEGVTSKGKTNFQFSVRLQMEYPVVAEMSIVRLSPFTGMSSVMGIACDKTIITDYSKGTIKENPQKCELEFGSPVVLPEGANYGTGPGDPNYRINTYILLYAHPYNITEVKEVTVKLTFLRDDGQHSSRTINIPPGLRFTVTPDMMPWNCGFSTLIEIVGGKLRENDPNACPRAYERAVIYISRNMLFRYDNGCSGMAAGLPMKLEKAKTSIFLSEGYTGL